MSYDETTRSGDTGCGDLALITHVLGFAGGSVSSLPRPY